MKYTYKKMELNKNEIEQIEKILEFCSKVYYSPLASHIVIYPNNDFDVKKFSAYLKRFFKQNDLHFKFFLKIEKRISTETLWVPPYTPMFNSRLRRRKIVESSKLTRKQNWL